MELFNISLLWQLFNILTIILLIFLLYSIYRKVINGLKLRRKREEAIIDKLDELINLNKKIFEQLSKDKS
ncbi:putative membrane protein [Desulfohalotomaculum tongense]|nr:putative membrane protein [Desulforadius tongensis]